MEKKVIMFKCTECGCEYEIKPDFCDCGNDEFECIKPIEPEKKQEQIPEIKTENKVFEVKIEKPKMTRRSVDIPSLCIFILCIILSFIVIFFAWNPTQEENKNTQIIETKTVKNIPSIDKFWDNTPIKVEQPKAKEVKIQEPVKKIIVQQKPTNTQTKTVQKPKTVKTQSTKTIAKTTQTNTKQQTTQQVVKKTEPQKTLTQQTTQPKQTTSAPKQTTVPLTKNTVSTVEQTKNTAAAKQELANYKASLRNTIGRKIDFTRVIGDGNCTVSFKINSSGKLVNRSFSKQSSNITLNDAVYNAVMATPSYNPPPEAYNNETLNLNIKFYNGNFEITLN